MNANASKAGGLPTSGSTYGFSDKVVDGITLTVNSVILTLKSRAFIASFQVRFTSFKILVFTHGNLQCLFNSRILTRKMTILIMFSIVTFFAI